MQLCHEWRYRYNHIRLHGCESKLLFLYHNPPKLPIIKIEKTSKNPKCLSLPLPQAMPDDCKVHKDSIHSAVKAYRKYYKSEHKKHLVKWTVKNNNERENISKPLWW